MIIFLFRIIMCTGESGDDYKERERKCRKKDLWKRLRKKNRTVIAHLHIHVCLPWIVEDEWSLWLWDGREHTKYNDSQTYVLLAVLMSVALNNTYVCDRMQMVTWFGLGRTTNVQIMLELLLYMPRFKFNRFESMLLSTVDGPIFVCKISPKEQKSPRIDKLCSQRQLLY